MSPHCVLRRALATKPQGRITNAQVTQGQPACAYSFLPARRRRPANQAASWPSSSCVNRRAILNRERIRPLPGTMHLTDEPNYTSGGGQRFLLSTAAPAVHRQRCCPWPTSMKPSSRTRKKGLCPSSRTRRRSKQARCTLLERPQRVLVAQHSDQHHRC